MSMLEDAILDGAIKALRKRAACARDRADSHITTIDLHGQKLMISTPESTMAARDAIMWDRAAGDLLAGRNLYGQ